MALFACKYDGCSDDSSSSEESDNNTAKDDNDFEERMKHELQSEVISYSRRNTKTEKEASLEQPDDDLLYDPEEDKINERFTKHLQKANQNGQVCDETTDAILNCPGCMSLLCLNCQRHSKYKTQYRAMFTFNCKIADDTTHVPAVIDLSKDASSATIEDLKKVVCEVCNTPVGLLDSNGVYHLFNVLASHS
nr:e2F associated phosphoprotein [Hymenolepis microstoma]